MVETKDSKIKRLNTTIDILEARIVQYENRIHELEKGSKVYQKNWHKQLMDNVHLKHENNLNMGKIRAYRIVTKDLLTKED